MLTSLLKCNFSNILMKNKARYLKCKYDLNFFFFVPGCLTPESTDLVATVLVLDTKGGQDGQAELEGGEQQLSVAGHGAGQEILITLLLRHPTDRQTDR